MQILPLLRKEFVHVFRKTAHLFANTFFRMHTTVHPIHTTELFINRIQRHLLQQTIADWQRRGTTLLDINCGDGRFLKFLWHSGFDVTATEHSHTLRSHAAASIEDRAEIFACEASDLPFEPHQFDWTVLHLRDCDAPLLSDTLKEAIRVSRQGLAITFWNSSAPAFFLSLKRKGHEGFSWWKVFSALREEHEGSISTLTTLLFSFAPLRRLWPRLYFSTFSTRFPLGAWAVLRLDLSPRSTHTPLFLRTGLRRIQRLEPLDGTSCYSPQEISSHLSTLRNTLYVKEDKPKK